MPIELPDNPNRRVWITTVSVTGGIGRTATAVPFVASMSPSERARAEGGPADADFQALAPGELKRVEWRKQPIFILRRSKEMLEGLTGIDELLVDPHSKRSLQPEYAKNVARSLRPEFGVLIGICTHLGCIPTFRPTPGAADLGDSWPGGFYCPCHGSKFDLAGQVFKNVPAPTNLVIPAYHFASDTSLVIGVDP